MVVGSYMNLTAGTISVLDSSTLTVDGLGWQASTAAYTAGSGSGYGRVDGVWAGGAGYGGMN